MGDDVEIRGVLSLEITLIVPIPSLFRRSSMDTSMVGCFVVGVIAMNMKLLKTPVSFAALLFDIHPPYAYIG